MCRFQCGDDAFQTGQFVGGTDGFVIVDGEHRGTVLCGKVGVQGTDTRIVQPCRYRVGFQDLSVFVLHHEGFRSVYDAQPSQLDGGGRVSRMDALSACFGEYDFHLVVVQVMIDGTGGVASSAHARYQIVGIIASLVLHQLFFDFFADDRLQACHHVGVRMRPYGRTYHVVCVFGVAAPVAYGFIGGILQGFVSRGDRAHFGSQHLHFFHVDVLACHVGFAHIHHAFHVHQCADRSGRYSVLSGSGFGDDAFLSHSPCQQHLPDGVVYLVCACMVQVLPLQVNLASVFLRKPVGKIQGRGTSHVVAQQLGELLLEIIAIQYP